MQTYINKHIFKIKFSHLAKNAPSNSQRSPSKNYNIKHKKSFDLLIRVVHVTIKY